MTQTDQVYRHFTQGRSLTPLSALNLFGVMRLGARIWEIRQRGFKVRSTLVRLQNGKHVARYSLS